MGECLETKVMGVNICSAPQCGAYMRDDTKPCVECAGRGFNSVNGAKVAWTNSDWAAHREAECAKGGRP